MRIAEHLQVEINLVCPHSSRVQFIRDIHASKAAARQAVTSFEFFPPKTDEGDKNLLTKTIPELMKLKPDYCSVTYGAGGSTRDKTLMIVDRIQRDHGLTAMAHLTCVNSTREQIGEVLAQARNLGIKNILALRGDPPGGVGPFTPIAGGFEYSHQLVKFISQVGGYCIGVAGFPEGHIACAEGKLVDWDRLKAKIDSGADFVLTQLFFENGDFLEFRDHMVKKLGTQIPVCPGVLPILSASQIQRFTALCGSKLPARLLSKLETLVSDDAAAVEFGIEYATQQCQELLRNGVPGIHFYTLNKSYSTTKVMKNLGLG